MTIAQKCAAQTIRDRVLDGLAVSIKERGYTHSRVGDIVRYANTSRRTLYETFATKDDCFAALLDSIGEQLCRHIESVVDPTAPRTDQVRQAVAGLIEFIAAEPELGRSWSRAMAVAGSSAAHARRRCIDQIAETLLSLSGPKAMEPQGVRSVRRYTAVMLVCGICELTAWVIENGVHVGAATESAVQAAVNVLAGP